MLKSVLFFFLLSLGFALSCSPSVTCVAKYNVTVHTQGPTLLNTANLIATSCTSPTYTITSGSASFSCNDLGTVRNVYVTLFYPSLNTTVNCSTPVSVYQNVFCLQNYTAYLGPNGNVGVPVQDLVSPQGYCANFTFAANETSYNCSNLGANYVKVTATTTSGWQSNCTLPVYVQRSSVASLSCYNKTFYVPIGSSLSLTASNIYTLHNQCATITSTLTPSSLSISSLTSTGVVTINATVKDSGGASISCNSYSDVYLQNFLLASPGFKSKSQGLTKLSWTQGVTGLSAGSAVSLYFKQDNGTVYNLGQNLVYSTGHYNWNGTVVAGVTPNNVYPVFIKVGAVIAGVVDLIISS